MKFLLGMKKVFAKKNFYLSGLALVITLFFCVAVVYYWEYVNQVQGYGYLGIFIISLLAGSIMLIPLPYAAVVFTLGGVLNPALVGVASGLGASIGAITIYLAGYGGHSLLPNVNNSLYSRLMNWVQRRGSVAVFIMSAVFNPLFIPMTIAMGMLRFRLWKFFLLCWAGFTVKSLAIAYCGYFGLGTLLRWLGINV